MKKKKRAYYNLYILDILENYAIMSDDVLTSLIRIMSK